LRPFPRLLRRIPNHEAFSRVFRLLDPGVFEACFGRYVAALAERVEGGVAFEGKTARRSFERIHVTPHSSVLRGTIMRFSCGNRLDGRTKFLYHALSIRAFFKIVF